MFISKEVLNKLGFVVHNDILLSRDGVMKHHETKELLCVIMNDEDSKKVNDWITENYSLPYPFITKHISKQTEEESNHV